MRWFIHAFKNIFNYQGRARRAEYGWFMLTNFLLQIGFVLVFFVLAAGLGLGMNSLSNNQQIVVGSVGIFAILINIALFIYGILVSLVTLSLTARRLHDLGWSGWWQLLLYVAPFALAIPMIAMIPDLKSSQSQEEIANTILFFNFGVGIICLIYFIFMLILLFKDGQKHANKYGESPKYPSQVADSTTTEIVA